GSKGNQELFFYTPVTDIYVHIGVITSASTNQSDWKYSKFNWGVADAAARATSLGNSKWSYTITGGLRNYFGITNPTEKIEKIAILFRNGNGSKVQRNIDGSDMFIPVYTSDLAVRITNPTSQPTYIPKPDNITKQIGDPLSITAQSNNATRLRLYLNGALLQTENAVTTITSNTTITVGGNQQIIAEAFDGSITRSDTINFYVENPINIAPLPSGVIQGINYNSASTSATMVLFAPGKNRVSIIGDFPGSNWVEQASYQLNKTPDGNYWWITLNGLTPGTEYSYQYLIDGTLRIADPYTEKVLDPWNDQYISTSTYPNLKPYPVGKTSGIVSVLHPGKASYSWGVPAFAKPDKRSLVIYELLVRDFVETRNWNTLRDTLNYLKNLGINAIEIMPFNEFEGNESWGYNSSFYFAPDKYYGPANTLKEFIDSCHANGIAVIMDIALNHSFGQSPMVQMYWDANNNRPASNNPWFNPVAKHAFNVGYDMNHEKLETRYFVSRVINHWLNEYKIDGFRWDLSKGFTQTQTCDNSGGNCNVASWSNYDASRVAIWKRYYDTMQVKSPGSYCILEHFADNAEERELSDYGMMLWGNANHQYSQAAMGYTSESDFSYGFANVRNWTNPYLITYMESHDEERLMTKNLLYGNSSGGYNTKDLNTALQRMELAAAFFLTIPGPKMIWQFGEFGYDYSINYCENNGTINSNCRLNNRPVRWDYFQNPNRKKLYDTYSKLLKLRQHPSFQNTFITNITEQSLGGDFKWIKLGATSGKVVVIGNFGVVPQTGSVTFPSAGMWYDYMNGTTFNATGSSQSFTLQPGQYFVYTSSNAVLPVTLTSFEGMRIGNENLLIWKVEDEKNLSHYELEISSDGQNFQKIASVIAALKSVYNYSDTDADSHAPAWFYRLKMVDKDGKFALSSVVKINSILGNWRITATPNPFISHVQLTIESSTKGNATIVISDLTGKKLSEQQVGFNAGKNSFEIKESSGFSRGTYLLSIISGGEIKTMKVVKGIN
ncbi:MAG: alpha-amylase family glycosyl hydrolase, partial [Ginsengibacter sp.]